MVDACCWFRIAFGWVGIAVGSSCLGWAAESVEDMLLSEVILSVGEVTDGFLTVGLIVEGTKPRSWKGACFGGCTCGDFRALSSARRWLVSFGGGSVDAGGMAGECRPGNCGREGGATRGSPGRWYGLKVCGDGGPGGSVGGCPSRGGGAGCPG